MAAGVLAAEAVSAWWLVAVAFAGAFVAVVGNIFVQLLTRKATVEDRARAEAREAYVAFLVDANLCAHQIGNLCPNQWRPEGADDHERKDAAYYFDRDTSAKFRVVELAGSAKGVAAALEMRNKLRDFRDRMCKSEAPLPWYPHDEYKAEYDPFVQARKGFIDVARRELRVFDG